MKKNKKLWGVFATPTPTSYTFGDREQFIRRLQPFDINGKSIFISKKAAIEEASKSNLARTDFTYEAKEFPRKSK